MRTTRTMLLLRSSVLAAIALLVAATAATAEARSLTLDERVAAQQAIDQVYWGHRIWPDANPHPKPPLAPESTEPAVRAKVVRSLSLSFSVESARHAPLTGAELQEEMERMAAETKAANTLRELFAALQDDPFLVAECLARPALVSRLAQTAGIHADGRERGPWELDNAAARPPAAGYVLPAIRGGVACTDDSWAVSSLTGGTGARVPSARQLHTAVWTGAEMIVWGGRDGANPVNNGGAYDPATDSWLVSSLTNGAGTNVPSARSRHTAVWTGSEMIVWGGVNVAGTALGNGGRYEPATDSWAPSSLVNGTGTNVPSARQLHTAVWTGGTMIVWGGTPDTPANALNTGGIFDPATDGWTVSLLTNGSGSNVPAARVDHAAVWADTEMIVWGGRSSSNSALNTGGIYDPGTDSWAVTILNNASGARVPSPRFLHTAVWSGSDMIVWGGASGGTSPVEIKSGGRYSRLADTWLVTSLTNGTGTRVPTARFSHTAIWTGGEMIVWGGQSWNSTAVLNTGGRYSPVADGWAVSSLTDATGVRVPAARQLHTAVWTGGTDQQMIVWGGNLDVGSGVGAVTDSGGLYCTICPLSMWHADADLDGYGDPAATITTCSPGTGYVASADDCNDANFAIHPGASELCDGLDNDCDTVTDNGGEALCADANACTADACRGAGGCAAPPSTVDLDGSGFSAGRVDGRDLVVLAGAWNACPGDPRYNAAANLDQGTSIPASCVDMSDFHLFMNSFGQICP